MSRSTKQRPGKLIGRYHTTKDGQLHDGHSAECKICQRAKSKPPPKKLGRRPSAGPPRRCDQCGTRIDRKNKTGLCMVCLTAKKKAEAEAKPARQCKRCGGKISKKNKSGVCQWCIVKAREQGKPLSEWQDDTGDKT